MGIPLCSTVLYRTGSGLRRILKGALCQDPCVAGPLEGIRNKKRQSVFSLLDLSTQTAQPLSLPCAITPPLKEFKALLLLSSVTFPLMKHDELRRPAALRSQHHDLVWGLEASGCTCVVER